jgi:hypothetical protein
MHQAEVAGGVGRVLDVRLDGLPTLLFGRGGGMRPGRHIRYAEHTPMNNLFLTLLDHMGIPIESLGDSTGKLAPLTDV